MIVVDVETTGLEQHKNSIVSIGAIEFEKPRNQFYEECRIWDGAEIDDYALKINGFTREQIIDSNKQSLEEAVKKFLAWAENIEDRTPAGENPSFDIGFLNNSCNRYQIKWTLGHRSVDMHSLAYLDHIKREQKIPLSKNRTSLNTNKILNYVGLPAEPDPHHALNGAVLEAEAFCKLIYYGMTLTVKFGHYELPEGLKHLEDQLRIKNSLRRL